MDRSSFVKKTASLAIEALGKGGGREGKGGADNCACPNKKCSEYGKPVSHTRGTPCNKMTCKKCGTALTGLGAPKSKIKETKDLATSIAKEIIGNIKNDQRNIT